MSHAISIRMGEAEAMHVKVQAMKQGKTQTEIVREAIWRDAAVAEIRDQTRQAIEKEFDMLFARIAADYSVELQTQLAERGEKLETKLAAFVRALSTAAMLRDVDRTPDVKRQLLDRIAEISNS